MLSPSASPANHLPLRNLAPLPSIRDPRSRSGHIQAPPDSVLSMKRLPAIALLWLAGCGGGPLIPEGAVAFDPPANYADHWARAMRESGIERDVSRVRWFLVPGGLFATRDAREQASGRWIPDGRIYLAEGWENDELTVLHEMLHELLRGDPNHEHPLFEVYDAEQCVAISGRLVPCSSLAEPT